MLYFLKGQDPDGALWFAIKSDYSNGKITLATIGSEGLPTEGSIREHITVSTKSVIQHAAKKLVRDKAVDIKIVFNKEDSITGIVRPHTHTDNYEVIDREDNVPFEAHEIWYFRNIITECLKIE